jgi:DNA mismatch endonuclease, patch repair protein
MADRAGYPRSAVMSRIRSSNTTPEVRLRRGLHARGVRFRLGQTIRTGEGRPIKPDLAFKGRRLAVFVDGCFWHGCDEHFRMPSTNKDYWSAKISRNAQRDAATDQRLTELGWQVIRVWEHDDIDEVVDRVAEALRSQGNP